MFNWSKFSGGYCFVTLCEAMVDLLWEVAVEFVLPPTRLIANRGEPGLLATPYKS